MFLLCVGKIPTLRRSKIALTCTNADPLYISYKSTYTRRDETQPIRPTHESSSSPSTCRHHLIAFTNKDLVNLSARRLR